MPHYLVECTFNPEAILGLPGPHHSLQIYLGFMANNDLAGASWICSYVTPNRLKSF